MTFPLEPDCSQRELAASCRYAVMLSSAITANISYHSNEIALSPTPSETLAPSFGAGKPQHLNIPFAPPKSRLDVWVSNCQFCTEIGPQDNLASGTAIPLVFASMKTVLVLVVHLLATVATHRIGSQPALRDAFDSCLHDGLTGFSVTVSLVEIEKSGAHPLFQSPARTDV